MIEYIAIGIFMVFTIYQSFRFKKEMALLKLQHLLIVDKLTYQENERN